MQDKFLDIYNKVFDENGGIKPCGRNITISLIDMAKKLDPGKDFGNTHTGIMNVDNIKKLYETIK